MQVDIILHFSVEVLDYYKEPLYGREENEKSLTFIGNLKELLYSKRCLDIYSSTLVRLIQKQV